jgi:hypothetical protein
MTDQRELVEKVAELIERTCPDLIDPRVPAHILKDILRQALSEALRSWIEEQGGGEQVFNLFMRRIVSDAVDSLLAARSKAC